MKREGVTRIPEEGRLLRIYLGEQDQWEGQPLSEAIVHLARQQGLAGATVLRGVMGFGAKNHLHTSKILRLSEDLPVLVEIVDTDDRIQGFLHLLEPMICDGLVTIERVEVKIYRSGEKR